MELKSYWLDHCNLVKTEHILFSVQLFMWLGRVEYARARRNDKIREYLSSALGYLRRVSHFDRVGEQDILAHMQYLDDQAKAEPKRILPPLRNLNGTEESHVVAEGGFITLKNADLFEASLEELEDMFSGSVLSATPQKPEPIALRSIRGRNKTEAPASPMIFKSDRPKRAVGNKTPKPKTTLEKEAEVSKEPNSPQVQESARRLRPRRKL